MHRIPLEHNVTSAIMYMTIPSAWKQQCRLVARSLSEWLTESGLTAAYLTSHTEEQQRARDRNAISLSQVARKIHL